MLAEFTAIMQHAMKSRTPSFERAAAIYTIVQTSKLNGVSPEVDLRDALVKIADGHPINRTDELMPWA